MKLKIHFILIFFIFSFCYGQENLSKFNTSWSSVITGKVVSEPAITSFGFVLICDDRSICAFTNSGKLLWQKSLAQYRDSKVFSLPEDFLLLVKNSNRTICLLNPSGYEIWTKDFEFPIFGNPLPGRDGRFFVRTLNEIYCFGITGVCKWKLDLPKQSSINLQELPDGSFVTFLEQLEDGKSKGLRISPFGEILEEIIFAGKIINVSTCNYGVLLTFTDGNAGFFALSTDKKIENKWVLNSKNLKPSKNQILKANFLVSDDGSQIFYILPDKNSTHFYRIDITLGSSLDDFSINKINSLELRKILYQNGNIFLSDFKNGAYFSDGGKIYWEGNLPYSSSKQIFNYIIFTKNDFLILCNNDWSLDAYRMQQALKEKSKQEIHNSYKDFFNFSDNYSEYFFEIDRNLASEKRISLLKKGFYGPKEIEYATQLIDACESYSASINSKATNYSAEKSIFETQAADVEIIMLQLSLFSDSQFNSYISKYLKTINNRTVLFALLNGLSENGYDPDLRILNALDVLAGKVNYKDELLLNHICDCVYSLCVFMGRPAYNSRGRDLVTKMLSANYTTKTRIYARNTLKKIADLEL